MSFEGKCKLFNPMKGFGFITSAEGVDIFLHIGAVVDGGVPQSGDVMKFDLEESKLKPGQMQASNVSGGTGSPATKGGGKGGPAPPAGAHQGSCKSFNGEKGFGFIIGGDGADIFFHVRGMTDGTTPQAGDALSFDLEESKIKPGQMQASNIQGGTGWAAPKGGGKDGGKGYGAAKGGDSWGGDSWGAPAASWGGDSWGGGKAGPYGGGKDSGKGDSGGGKGKMMAMMQQMMSSWGGSGGGGGDSWGASSGGGGDAAWGASSGAGGGASWDDGKGGKGKGW